MAEDLRSPGFADQVVVHQDAAMRFELFTRLQIDYEMFVPQPDQLGQVAVARDRGRGMDGHASILVYFSSIVTLSNLSPGGVSTPICASRGVSDSRTSMPLSTCPKIVYLPSNSGTAS